jgi:exonuclease VII small subunit
LTTLSLTDLETLVAALEEETGPRSAAFRKRLQRATQRLRAAWRKRDELA